MERLAGKNKKREEDDDLVVNINLSHCYSYTNRSSFVPVRWMRAEPVWAYRQLWLDVQQVMLDSSSTNLKKIHKLLWRWLCFLMGNVVHDYHQLMIEWRVDVLKGSQSTVGRVRVTEAYPRIPEGRYSNPADDQNCPFWCRLHTRTEKLVQIFPNVAAAADHLSALSVPSTV